MLDRLIESAVNRLLAMDPNAGERLAPLAGRSVDLSITGFPDPARFRFYGNTVLVERVTSEVAAEPADAKLSGSAFAFLQSGLGDGAAVSAGIKAEGDAELALKVAGLVKSLDIDFEDELAKRIGDMPARQLSRVLHHARAFFTDGADRVSANVSEFLREESDTLVDAADINRFLDDVDDVRAEVDAFERRLKILEDRESGS